MKRMRLFLLTLAVSQLMACKGTDTSVNDMESRANPTFSTLKALELVAGKKIFFGHQSVGLNIMEGLESLSQEMPAPPVNLVETSEQAAFNGPVFAHARVGENTRPSSKLSDFEGRINAGIGQRADIALLKLCYVDISAPTKVEELLREYQDTMTRIMQRYPKLVIVHVTVPLRTVERGIKARIKQLAGIGKPADYADNIKRNQFNTLLRGRYLGKEPIFDLAALEATAPDGSVETFSVAGRSYQALFPGYSDDGGHLAPMGRKRAAQGLLMTLSALP